MAVCVYVVLPDALKVKLCTGRALLACFLSAGGGPTVAGGGPLLVVVDWW